MKKVSGIVVKGHGKGKLLGFPTANIELKEPVESGVYEGCAYIYGAQCKAAIFVSKDGKLLEMHIMGLEDNLYGKEIEVEIGEKIREVQDFKTDEDLHKQIEKDVRDILNFS